MIGSLFCLLLPALGGCSSFVDYVPSPAQIVRHQAFYDGKNVFVTGRVKQLNQWRSRAGTYLFQAFFVCGGSDCVHVVLESPSPIRTGELVAVRGPYYRRYRSRASVAHNEIEATEVLAGE